MNWLRNRIRKWLYVNVHEAKLSLLANSIDAHAAEIEKLRAEVAEFKKALKARAQQAPRAQHVVDYESSQAEAMKEFEEKK